LPGYFVAEEQPVFGSELGGANGVFDEVVANFYPAIAQVGFEVAPLVDGVADGFAKVAFGEYGTGEGEFIDGFFEPPVDDATCFDFAPYMEQERQRYWDKSSEIDVVCPDPEDPSRLLVSEAKWKQLTLSEHANILSDLNERWGRCGLRASHPEVRFKGFDVSSIAGS